MPIKYTCRHCGETNYFNFSKSCKFCYREFDLSDQIKKKDNLLIIEETEHELKGESEYVIKRIIKALEDRKDFNRSDGANITCNKHGEIKATAHNEKKGYVSGRIYEKNFKCYAEFQTIVENSAKLSPIKALIVPILLAIIAVGYLIVKNFFFKLLTIDIFIFLIIAFISAIKFLNFSSSTNKTLENLKIAKSEALRIVKSAERDYE